MVTARPRAVSAAAVPVAFVLVNTLSYALLLAGAHLLSASAYGQLSSLLGLLLISTIPMLALQTVTARRCATADGPAGIVRATAVVGLGSAAVLALLSPALAAFLHLHEVTGVLLVAASVPAGAVLGAAMGVAQGRRNFGRLAVLILATIGSRSAAGILGLLIGRTPNATLAGIAIGVSIAAAVVAGTSRGLVHLGALRDPRRSGALLETLHAAHAHGAFLLLTSLDVLLARHVLPGPAAGAYAAGAVLTRATLWLPQAVIAVLFASLSDVERHHRTVRQAVLVVVVLGGLVTAAAAVAGPLVVQIIGGTKYHALDNTIWLFAVLGTLLAILQLSVLAGLAQRTARRAALVWATIVADVAVVLSMGSAATPTRLVVALVTVASASAGVALWLAVRRPLTGTLLRAAAVEGVEW